MRFKDKTVIVTGAARGLAETTARLLAAEGANLVAADINLARLNDVVGSINQAGAGKATAVEVDVTSKSMIQNMVDVAVRKHGRVDAIVNIGAGYAPYRGLVETSEEEWERIIDSNLKSIFLCCQAVLPVMLDQRYGRIVNISSLAARTYSHFLGAHYAAAKAGVLGLTRHIAHEYGPRGICANAVCPTAFYGERLSEIMTPEKEQALINAIPLRRIPTAEDIAPAIAFLASDDAVFVSGVSLDVNGAQVTS
ncbi:SDR family NAD(P)-dependent oxidoreductase [Variovorax sp. Sphag1AA]|uniref:SDR family NAD(P)-dependent oxidoreductase n=1 Tax=Variovorax sp. Sphag1AA TaxID=2587027 RepID=UPI0016120260|nr:SDR family NAD(P)-dependent oxidoreductase [Variovorax sp. Sphag1AA]MBB3181223.1 3-oxoacyl-[acyl-carrier protein] reductase [Variovorax sp. Sphag1AA]